jgi:hypothetical protein
MFNDEQNLNRSQRGNQMMNITKATDLINLITNNLKNPKNIKQGTHSMTGGEALQYKITATELSTNYLLSRQWFISELVDLDTISELINNDEAFDIRKGDVEYGFALIADRLYFVQREDLD